MTTAGSSPGSDSAVARDFLDALLRAVTALRQLGRHHAVADAALQRFLHRCANQRTHALVEIELGPHTASCGGETVLGECHGALLEPLRALGVGMLVLPPGMAPAALQLLALGLADDGAEPEGGEDLVARLRAHGEAAPRLLPPAAPAAADRAESATIDQLAALPAAAAPARAACAREAALNLPVRLARLLLEDLGQEPDAEPRLQQAVSVIAARGDIAGCAMLLEQALQHPHLGASTRQEILAAAHRLFARQLEGPCLAQMGADALLTLAGLGVQLGGAAAAQLLQATNAAGVPLPDWLRDAIAPPTG